METVSFIIPNTDKSKVLKLSEQISDVKNENIKNENIKNEKVNINDYVKISTNVYRFNGYVANLDDNIYVLYNNALELKKENKQEALIIFKKCKELINSKIKEEIVYEILINLALLTSDLDMSVDEIENYYQESIKIYSDRSEPYYYWSIYCNKKRDFNKAYELLKKSQSLSYDIAKIKYPSTQLTAYGTYIYDELSITCYWLNKYEEAKELLEIIINEPYFTDHKERLERNLEFTKNKLENM